MLPSDTRIALPPFVAQPDGDDVILGNPARNCFLAVPPDAAALLRWLADGLTVGEACNAYEREYAARPDVEEFLATLAEQGFLPAADESPAPTRAMRGHFEQISVSLARRVCSWQVSVVGLVLAAAAVGASIADPSILPGPDALVFEHDQLVLAAGVALLTLVTVFFHELAHLVAARAADVPSRMGIGTRLWVLVAETDMSEIWFAPRRRRWIAFLAGPALDVCLAAALLLAIFAVHRNLIALPETILLLVRATTFVVFTRLLWQFYLFLPTDLYYALTTVFGCRNLMHDTQEYLVGWLARLTRRVPAVDQSGVPPREMAVVRWFAFVWLGGRAVAFASLFLITLPVLGGYAAMLARGLGGDGQAVRPLLDGPPLLILAAALQSFGVLAWLRSLVLEYRRSA